MTAIVETDYIAHRIAMRGAGLIPVETWCRTKLGMGLLALTHCLMARLPRGRLHCRVVGSDRLFLRLRVWAPNGAHGIAVRRIDLATREAYHSLLLITMGGRGGQLTFPLHQNFHALYCAIGLNRVRLHAALSVGSSLWAKYGFLPESDAEWRRLAYELRSRWQGRWGHVEPVLFTAIDALLMRQDRQALRDLCFLPIMYPDASTPLHRFLLDGQPWHGVLELTDHASVAIFLRKGGLLP